MIYSIVPIDQILFYEGSEKTGSRMEVTLEGEQVVLMKSDNNTYTIERLISTNPSSYLKPELMPGTMLMTVTAQKEMPRATWEIIKQE